MFAHAYGLASDYTHAIVVSARRWDGRVECDVGAFVVLDEEGWILTAAHMLEPATLHAEHKDQIADHERRTRELATGAGSRGASRDWVTNYSLWIGWDGVGVGEFHVLPGADLALGRLEPFDASLVQSYPVFREPTEITPGTSVSKLGYPFHTVATTFDEASDAFVFAEGAFPMPQFALEGMVTRIRSGSRTPDGSLEISLVETSTPGLRGQSGGPIFDVDGRLCAIQVHTVHYPLGFSPLVEQGRRRTEEHQFLNVGVGVHAATILPFLAQHGVRVRV